MTYLDSHLVTYLDCHHVTDFGDLPCLSSGDQIMVTYTLTATRLLGYQVKRLHHWRQQLFVIITINANTKLKITE